MKPANTFIAGLLTSAILMQGAALLGRTLPQGTVLRVANVDATFNYGADGGLTGVFRACGHEDRLVPDGGRVRVGEPCWAGNLSPESAECMATGVLPLYKAP